jgi:GNAT superfamily N-acetyltransferase
MEITTTKENKSFAIKIEAKEGGEVFGWAYLYIMYNDLHKEPFGFMENVFVKEEHRGKGLGTKLIEKLIEEAKAQKCYKLIGNSRYDNPRVHTMYQKMGFKNHGKEFRIDL